MTIETKYSLGDKVRISELPAEGRVISIWVSAFGLQVEVRYFMDGKAQKEYFFEDELTALK
jgi:hypothetical protein